MSLADIVCQMRTRHIWSVQALANVAYRRPKRAGHSRWRPADAHTLGLGRCCMLLADVVCQMRTRHGLCVQALVGVACCWLMRAGHGRWRPADAHIPRLMRAGLGWCCMPVADVVCQMRTCHVWCLQALADASCRWVTSPGRRPHATSDAWIQS